MAGAAGPQGARRFATVKEICQRVVEGSQFSEEQQGRPYERRADVGDRIPPALARTHLKAIGAIENSARGVWAITEKGRSITPEQMQAETKAWRAEFRRKRAASTAGGSTEEADAAGALTWKDELVGRLPELAPDGFERLAQRVLREAGS